MQRSTSNAQRSTLNKEAPASSLNVERWTLSVERCIKKHRQRVAFTLVELILVMVIVAILAGIAVPSLSGFRIGRANANMANQIVGLAQYARNMSATEGRTYRLNVNPATGEFWVSYCNDDGTYVAAAGDYGTTKQVDSNIKLDVSLQQQANVQMLLPSTVQQNAVQLPPPVIDPTIQQTNTLMQNQRNTQDGSYIEFQPSGRTDTAIIKLTDKAGSTITLGCLSATESFHILQPGELQ